MRVRIPPTLKDFAHGNVTPLVLLAWSTLSTGFLYAATGESVGFYLAAAIATVSVSVVSVRGVLAVIG